MQYGLIGEKLGHSYSKEIHELLGYYKYELKEIQRDKLEEFITSKEYCGLNVTIPYKEMVIPFLDYVDDGAKAIGAVNTIVNRDGKLYGYNTDFFGLRTLLVETGYDFSGKKVLILGTGGTSKTAKAVLESLGVKEVLFVSRSKKDGVITYEEALCNHNDVDFIVNTTPSGMFPNIDAQAIDLSEFKNIFGVMDVIYNPGRTKLMLQAEKLGKKAYGGLKMLVYQAIVAAEFFLDKKIDMKEADRIYRIIRDKNENIVLVGMPGVGKSTVGKALAKELKMEFVDTDACIVKREGREITDIFATDGEAYFRDVEAEVIREVSTRKNLIISTGGGAILRDDNVACLKAFGKLFFLNRDVNELRPTADRPLADNHEKMKALYNERLPRYKEVSDAVIDSEGGVAFAVNEIKRYRNEN